MHRLIPALLLLQLAACTGDRPISVAERQCRSHAERGAAADFRAYAYDRLARDLDLTDSPGEFDDILERACRQQPS